MAKQRSRAGNHTTHRDVTFSPNRETGEFHAEGLAAGEYSVEFWDASGRYASVYWEGGQDQSASQRVTVTGGQDTAGIDMTLAYQNIAVERLAGATRYDTNVAISQARFPDPVETPGIPVLYVANGETFPDALSAGPAAVRNGGELLLVTTNSVPTVVAEEIKRLSPQRIVVVGGVGAISPDVFSQLVRFAPDSTIRIGGIDRYETSRLLIDDAFSCPDVARGACSSDLLLASGSNFPDALAAVPAAGSLGAPVLLVDGSRDVDAPTSDLISRLNPSGTYVIGGSGVVSDAFVASLDDRLSTPSERVSGADRYETAAAVSYRFFPSAQVTFAATGAGFADALSGGALAAYVGSPIYLVQPNCIPPVVANDILDIGAGYFVILGGEGVVGTGVEELNICATSWGRSSVQLQPAAADAGAVQAALQGTVPEQR